jgi:hypothetical protein
MPPETFLVMDWCMQRGISSRQTGLGFGQKILLRFRKN